MRERLDIIGIYKKADNSSERVQPAHGADLAYWGPKMELVGISRVVVSD